MTDAPSQATEATMARKNAEPVEMASIVVTADHVYLPLDDAGKGRADWATTSEETSRIAKRARLMVPTDLAQLLSKRDQAEILR
jgi:hypothetical protein